MQINIEKKDGFKYEFDPSFCQICGGKCCTGESGYIWISKDEISKIAAFFGMSDDEFKKIFCYNTHNRYSLKEKEYNNGYACIFFDETHKNCGIYELRPKQCLTFPFWDYFKKNFKELEKECIGVKQLQ